MRLFIFLLMLLPGTLSWSKDARDPEVIKNIDLNRYMGKWYEVAHKPNFFQNLCEWSTAEYQLLENGKVSVLNRCYKGEKQITSISGTAAAKDNLSPTKLEVDFGFFRKGDYWIVDLDPNYQWAVVSGPSMKSLFILSRTAQLDSVTLEMILETLKERGFNTSNLIYDKQPSTM